MRQAASSGESDARCLAEVVSYDTARIGADPVYVEPSAAKSDSSGRVLLLGTVVYRFSPDEQRGFKEVARGSTIGLLIEPEGGLSTVESPVVATRINGIRMVGLPDNRWGIAFAELRPMARETAVDTAAALWFGEFDGRSWRRVDRLPMPDPAVGLGTASELLLNEGEMVWIVRTRGEQTSLSILRRKNQVWTAERLRSLAIYFQPLLSRSSDVYMAVVQGDSTLQSDGNSLLLRAPPRWSVSRVLRRSSDEPVYMPVRVRIARDEILSWATPGENGLWIVRARIGQADDPDRLVTVETAASLLPGHIAPVPSAAGPTWVLSRGSEGPARELRVIALDSAGGPIVLLRLPDPFLYPPIAVETKDGLMLSGPIAPDRRYLASLLMRISVRCSGARRPVP
jgi:hypothetical protein